MATTLVALVLLLGFPVTLTATVILARKLSRASKDLERFGPALDAEARVRELQVQHASVRAALSDLQRHHQQIEFEHSQRLQAEAASARGAIVEAQQRQQLAAQQHAHELLSASARADGELLAVRQEKERIANEVLRLEQRADLHEVGLLAPRFDFGEAIEYKVRLEQLVDQQVAMVKARSAALCAAEWTISGSRAEGKKTTDKILKLMLRAFNGECDALIAKVRYDNATSFEDRVYKSWESINKLGSGFSCEIASEYLSLKVQELHLTHEYLEKVQAEREEQRALREQMRDEERAQKELERAQRDAEQEEARYANALMRAREEAQHAVGIKQQRLLDQISDLEHKVAEAEERRQRAISMAQLTKRGHVYVLSNVGSFGEMVFKIGMTRRIVPQDRVDELGDASVPFPFDVHAMIHTEDAPGLERALHGLFDSARLNRINRRKEFFRVTLGQIEQVVRRHHGEFKLTHYAEALEYRKSLAAAQGPTNHSESSSFRAQAPS